MPANEVTGAETFRRRQTSGSEHDKHDKLTVNEGKGKTKASESAIVPQPRTTRSALLIIAALIALGLFTVSRGRSASLPRTYALCSRDGNIYTVDKELPKAECIVVHNSRILSVGSLEETRRRFGDADKTGPLGLSMKLSVIKNGIKLIFVKKGHIVVPGLTDAHAHVMEQGFKMNLELNKCSSLADALETIKKYISDRPDLIKNKDVWIQGWGWDQTKWPRKEFPTAADFDSETLLRGRPILMKRIDGHAAWVSSRVIEEAGDLPSSIEGGEIIRDKDGYPTGIFVDNAQSLIVSPPWTDEQMLDYYVSAMREALSYGLTSIHDAAALPWMINLFLDPSGMADANKLPLRLYLMGYAESDEYWGDQIERLENYGPAGRLTLRAVKLFTDGALGSWGAALLEPYADKPESSGLLLQSPEAMSKLVKRFWNDGFQVNIHCIGDKANNVALDIFEDLLQGENIADRRPRIEHAQIMVASDAVRVGRLGVIASVQPTHATNDMWYAETRLGPERVKHAYAYKTLLSNSAQGVLPLGSDFPVEGVNPLLGFYAAVMRLAEDGTSPHGPSGWFPEERLSRSEALKGMTYDAAYASFQEQDLGSLAPGKLADFVVLDTDIMSVEPARILQAKVMATVVDGRPAYGKL